MKDDSMNAGILIYCSVFIVVNLFPDLQSGTCEFFLFYYILFISDTLMYIHIYIYIVIEQKVQVHLTCFGCGGFYQGEGK